MWLEASNCGPRAFAVALLRSNQEKQAQCLRRAGSMEFRDKQIAPPRSWEKFEELCLAIFKAEWDDGLAQKHGRKGQPQQGVDVFGSPNGRRAVFHGVQCKGKDQTYGHKPTRSELMAE